MSNLIFPTPAVSNNWNTRWPIKKTPRFSTIVQLPASGVGELRIPLYTYPLWQFELDISYLLSDFSNPSGALASVVGFYMGAQGAGIDWLYNDAYDNAVNAMNFGTGDGTTTAFQLTRSLGSTSLDIVQNLNGTPSIYVAGVLTTPASISATGVVTFSSAPASGAALTWTGNFYFRCRFLEDALDDLEEDLYQIWSLKSLKFISVILPPTAVAPGGATVSYADEETPSGAINGTNQTFTLAHVPNPAASVQLFWNGVLQRQGVGDDYTISASTITTAFKPASGDVLLAWYRY